MKVFCIGLFRTGTTSLFEMFARSFRAAHEFQVAEQIKVLRGRLEGTLNDEEFRAFVRQREAAKPLEMDSCGAHFGIVDALVDEFPEAKFILTLRNVYSWMNSCIGKLYPHFVNGGGSAASTLINCLHFRSDGSYGWLDRSDSKICLEQMMKAWTSLNRGIQRVVPRERLLVLNTEDLARSRHTIASFCEIDESLLDPSVANQQTSTDFLSCFRAERMEELVSRHCSELMAERYPDLGLVSHVNREWSASAPDGEDVLRYFSLDRFVGAEFVPSFEVDDFA
jgi:hypothetical protein